MVVITPSSNWLRVFIPIPILFTIVQLAEISFLDWLKKNSSQEYSGYCWGYHYPWPKSDGLLVPKGTPNSVVTAFNIRAIFQYFLNTNDELAIELINGAKNFIINDVVEKPMVKVAPSNYAVIGRYILPKKIFNVLKRQKPGKNKEIHITDAIRNLIIKKNKFYGHIFAGKYLDCGSMKGYIESSLKISKL